MAVATLSLAVAPTAAPAVSSRATGTSFRAELLADLAPGPAYGSPSHFTVARGVVFFTADDAFDGRELWRTDGTRAGTTRVADIRPAGGSDPFDLTLVGDVLFFVADDGMHGRELWRSDGTAAGTLLVKDLVPGSSGSWPGLLTAMGGHVYFIAEDGGGAALWRSDGTEAGTVRVTALEVSGGSSHLMAHAGMLFFTAGDASTGHELWKSDGTAAGTALVADIHPGSASSHPMGLTPLGDSVFFTAADGTTGRELWRSDGTRAGTVLVKDLWPGPSGGGAEAAGNLTAIGSRLYFPGSDGTHGEELWASDGTAAGTGMVADINTGRDTGSRPRGMVESGPWVLFNADDEVHGSELWRTDGTAAGTRLVRDVAPLSFSSDPRGMTQVQGTVVFVAEDGVHGAELWRSDGTAAGTVLAADVRPDTNRSSGIGDLTAFEGMLLFSAYDGAVPGKGHGRELWRAVLAPDTVVEGAVVKARAKQRQRRTVKVVVRTSAEEAVVSRARGKVVVPGRAKRIKLTSSRTTAVAGETTTLRLTTGRRARVTILDAVRRYRTATTPASKRRLTVRARVRVAVTDRAGNSISKRLVVKLV